MKNNIIVTIPAYNEESTIGFVIKSIKRVMDRQKWDYKVLVVNDGSTDKTAEISKREGAIVYDIPYRVPLAEVFRTEIKKCLELKADIIVHIDADGQYLASEIPDLIKEVEAGYELVLGSRFLGKIEEMPLLKKIGNRAFSRAISKIIGYKVTDCQTGFRAFTKELARNVEIISNHTYTQEQIIKSVFKKYKIKEVPAYFGKRIAGESRLMKNPFEYAIKAWINLLRIYRDYVPLKFFGAIGTGFLSVGLLIGAWLVYFFITTGSVKHIPSAILSLMLVTLGIQIILFGFLADMRK